MLLFEEECVVRKWGSATNMLQTQHFATPLYFASTLYLKEWPGVLPTKKWGYPEKNTISRSRSSGVRTTTLVGTRVGNQLIRSRIIESEAIIRGTLEVFNDMLKSVKVRYPRGRGAYMHMKICWTAYAISKHIKVGYWRAPVRLRYKDESLIGSPTFNLSLEFVLVGVVTNF